MIYRPDTVDGLFHSGNPLTGEKGTPLDAAFLNELLGGSSGVNYLYADSSESTDTVPLVIDSSTGTATVHLAGSEVVVTKLDDTGVPSRLFPASGLTVLRQPYIDLNLQDDFVRLRLYGTNYNRV